jgi:hypothetical protein
MNDRKQTPDILADILTGEAPDVDLPLAPPPARLKKTTAPRPKRAPAAATTPKSAQPAAPAAPPASHGWVFQVISLQDLRGWRPRYIDGQPVKDWENGLLLHDLLAWMGEQGWELASACCGEPFYGRSDRYQLIFKKPA